MTYQELIIVVTLFGGVPVIWTFCIIAISRWLKP